ncbi:uncharacterized protein M421DRAFT_74040 [Didymella exigua CBS 183.55]|uniref:Glucose receptor Git3-like N-terminal domain-containing protein n=1 Tax=Didymella exigua CBS 183.55 TaxID=1150837 RepID=A0A6A5R9F7_9PLEO|nr:uncharacterized protein M421DRAFT_74040 [Didymella exigua CBS 183.55]KAF1923828.1 hypothetical protein M421DRAFT_74040 [Didymella exigua CBS 183.55]
MSNLVLSVPPLVGSLSSAIASFTVLVFHIFYQDRRHFRHALVVNLLVADFLNAFNNSVSGIAIFTRADRKLQPGPACNFNGWLGQITVQTVDFSIIAIAIVVLITIKTPHIVSQPSAWKAAALCVLVWVPGTITSFTALGRSFYGPVSGNWCWIKPSLRLERYLLTHMWRIAIFISTVGVYIWIHVSLHRMYGDSNSTFEQPTTRSYPVVMEDRHYDAFSPQRDDDAAALVDDRGVCPPSVPPKDPSAKITNVTRSGGVETTRSGELRRSRKKEIQRILLLNGYPFMYIILWIPGIMNRVVEAARGKSPVWLIALQASTQFVGLANALVYGWNEGLRRRVFKR